MIIESVKAKEETEESVKFLKSLVNEVKEIGLNPKAYVNTKENKNN